MQEADNGYIVVGTKVRPEAFERLQALCAKQHMTLYELMQMVCDTLIRYMDDQHNLTPDMEQAMSIFEHLRGWKDSINLADYTIHPHVMEATYYLRDEKCKGVRAVHVERPWLENSSEWGQTYNIQEIVENTICLLMPERYRRLRMMAIDNDCNSILQLFDTIIDEYSNEEYVHEIRKGFEDAARSDFGKKPNDTPYKRKHHKSIESVANSQQLKMFNNDNEEE